MTYTEKELKNMEVTRIQKLKIFKYKHNISCHILNTTFKMKEFVSKLHKIKLYKLYIFQEMLF